MTAEKDLKRLVRARMKKTGEASTTARAQVTHKTKQPSPNKYALLAGMSDAALKAKTGCAWDNRIGWSDGSIIAVGFVAKGDSKSSVAVEHTKLPDRETAERLKNFWSEKLGALGEVLRKR